MHEEKNQLQWSEIYFASCSPRFQSSVGSIALGLRWSRSTKSREYGAKAAHFLFRMRAETGRGQPQVLFCKICTSWSTSFNQALSLTMAIIVNSTSWGRVERQGKYWRLEEKGLPLTLESSQSLSQQRSKNSSILLLTTPSQLPLDSSYPACLEQKAFPPSQMEKFEFSNKLTTQSTYKDRSYTKYLGQCFWFSLIRF